MEIDELEKLEHDRSERKANWNNEWLKTICAFVNDLPNNKLPGYLILGQNNDLSYSNWVIDESTRDNISNIKGNGKIQLPHNSNKSMTY